MLDIPSNDLDCLSSIMGKVRQDRRVINKAIYIALGVNLDGEKEVLGLWLQENEGAKFWLSVLTELKTHGVQDIFIACGVRARGLNQMGQSSKVDRRSRVLQMPLKS